MFRVSVISLGKAGAAALCGPAAADCAGAGQAQPGPRWDTASPEAELALERVYVIIGS